MKYLPELSTSTLLALILVPAIVLGFYRRFWWTVLFAVVLALWMAQADLRNALGESPYRKESEAVVWLSLMFHGLFSAIGWAIGRAAAFAWARIR